MAVKKQRLVKSVVWIDGKPKITDFTLADQEWDANTDLSRAPTYVKERTEGGPSPAPVSTLSTEAVSTAPVSTERPSDAKAASSDKPAAEKEKKKAGAARPGTMAYEAAREKQASANLKELEYAIKAGQLLPADEIEAEWTSRVTQVRTALLAMPSKLKGLLPELTHAQLAVIDEQLRTTLEQLADAAKAERLAGTAA